MINIFNPVISKVEGGGKFNIHYGLNPPEDTSMLWVETEKEPTSFVAKEGDLNPFTLDETIPYTFRSAPHVKVGNKLYVFGGMAYKEKGITYRNTIFTFDTKTRVCEKLTATLPYSVYHTTAVCVGKQVYICGGRNSSYLDSIIVFDTETETSTTLDVKLPHYGERQTCALVGTTIYIMGYYGNDYSTYGKSIFALDVESNIITTLDVQFSTLRHTMIPIVEGNFIYLFGGCSGSTNATNLIQVFDTESNTITDVATMPQRRDDCACARFGNTVYIMGGSNTSTASATGGNTAPVLKFDIDTGTVSTTSYKILPDKAQRVGMAAVAEEDMIYALGGTTSNSVASLYRSTIEGFSEYGVPLTRNAVHLKTTLGTNVFPIINGNSKVNIGVEKVYIGDNSNIGRQAEAYLYDKTTNEWKLVE